MGGGFFGNLPVERLNQAFCRSRDHSRFRHSMNLTVLWVTGLGQGRELPSLGFASSDGYHRTR